VRLSRRILRRDWLAIALGFDQATAALQIDAALESCSPVVELIHSPGEGDELVVEALLVFVMAKLIFHIPEVLIHLVQLLFQGGINLQMGLGSPVTEEGLFPLRVLQGIALQTCAFDGKNREPVNQISMADWYLNHRSIWKT
jgi:hypothetical protein